MRNQKIKKYNKKVIYTVLVFILIGIYLCSNFFSNNNLINDYYMYINKEVLDKEDINVSEVGWSNFTKAQDKVDKDVKLIIKELINSKNNVDLNVFYNNIMNTSKRNEVGINPLMKYINLIDSSKNINEFINNSILIENELCIDILTRTTVAPDFKDTSKNIVYFYPITFDFSSSSDIYVNSDYSRYHALVKQYQIKLLKLYGYDKEKAREVSDNLDEFFTDISNKSKINNDLNNVESLYNIVTKEELQKIYTNIDINNYLEIMGISSMSYFSVVDIENYKMMNSYLTNDNLSLLKEYVKVKILENYGSYASIEYANLVNELNDKLMGISSSNTLEAEAIDLVNIYFSNEVNKIYLERNFNEKDKLFMEDMIKDILSYYENNINKNIDWMDSLTKKKAILKLKNMKVNVGGNYSPSYDYNLKLFEENSSLIENIISINRVLSKEQLLRLESNKYETIISPTTVNAYYNPLDNSINFPACLKELYSQEDDYYSILGSMGMIVAHEITHAFDNNGSKFDENGNMKDWWSKSDYSNFERLQEDIVNYYSNYEVIDGLYVDGEMTVGENIADLGAVNCIVGVAHTKGATVDDYKKVFSSYASLWRSEYIDSYQKLLVLSDVHSPDRIRVNAVLSSCDKFYEVYDIDKEDLMYVDKDKRVGIW